MDHINVARIVHLIKSLLIFYIPLLSLHFLLKRRRRASQLPPGPKGLPILGNLLQLRATANELPWITYNNWAEIYGDVFTFNVLGSRTVVLNSYKVIVDLLERRSYNYSDRPWQQMLHELLGWGWILSLMPYGDSWRLHRRIFHQSFRPMAVPQYYNIQREKTALLIQKLTLAPKDFTDHVRAHSGEILLEIVFGYRTQEMIDPYIKLVDKAMVGMNAVGVPGTYLVDYFPPLRYIPAWFPGASFKIKAKVWAQENHEFRNQPWTLLKDLVNKGDPAPCFCTQNLERFKISTTSSDTSDMEEVIKNVAGIAYLAGAETSVSAIESFTLAMVLNPEVQAQAQKELDEVIGTTRLPDLDDRKELPYINALLAETLRWNPVLPLTLLHQSLNDDIYEGYLIPGGSIIVPNAWAVLHDESVYGPDTMNFNPDRFIKQDWKDVPLNPEVIVFGFGRRVCPGRYLAVNSLWLAITYLLTHFTIAKEIDSEGKEITPVVEYTHGLSSHPRRFDCRFIPRPSAPLFSQNK
ncbi:cytochrome P450 [Marasmius fiardii PR-910]|nr:cytochrome P450 [Marasmius fiardii PR-910]